MDTLIETPKDWQQFKLMIRLAGYWGDFQEITEIDDMVILWDLYRQRAIKRSPPKMKAKWQRLERDYRHAVNGLAKKVYQDFFWDRLQKD